MEKTDLMQKYEDETSKHAVWGGDVTKQYKQWKRRERFRIVIDTREKRPYRFKKSVVKKLDEGDYAPLGYEDKCAIERKAYSDWERSITQGRDRLEKEILRAKEKLNYFAILIESDLRRIWHVPSYSTVKRETIVNCIPYWSVKYNIPIFFGSNRTQSKYLIEEICKAYVRYKERDKYKELFKQVYGEEEG